MSPHILNDLYVAQLGLESVLFLLIAVRLMTVRRPLIVPGWIVSLTIVVSCISPPGVGAFLYLFPQSPGRISLGLLGISLIYWIIFRLNRGYHFVGASEESVSSALLVAVDSGALEYDDIRQLFKIPVPEKRVLIHLWDSLGVTKMTVTPWGNHALLQDLSRWARAYYRSQSSPNSLAAEASILILALMLGTGAFIIYGIA